MQAYFFLLLFEISHTVRICFPGILSCRMKNHHFQIRIIKILIPLLHHKIVSWLAVSLSYKFGNAFLYQHDFIDDLNS